MERAETVMQTIDDTTVREGQRWRCVAPPVALSLSIRALVAALAVSYRSDASAVAALHNLNQGADL